MKSLILLPLLSVCVLEADSRFSYIKNPTAPVTQSSAVERTDEVLGLGNQQNEGPGKMSATVFKYQQYCRAELKDFAFDAHFSVTGATVYFSGANFKGVEKGVITGPSLKPIESLMMRCIPGSIVVFDDVKVIGPDNEKRTIPGVTYILF